MLTNPQFEYRISRFGEICQGLFTSSSPDAKSTVEAATAATAPEAESGTSRKMILLAHIVATKSTNPTVLDEDMALPPDWRSIINPTPKFYENTPGEGGTTVCIHSLAVLPEYHGRGLGSILLKGYISRIRDAKICDRLALITYDSLTGYYEKFGFRNIGKSKATFGGVAWVDMVRTLLLGASEPFVVSYLSFLRAKFLAPY
jgi:GNAT superfamily N-acetyltransferase